MSQIVLTPTKRIDVKQFFKQTKQLFTNTLLTDTGLVTIFAIIMAFSAMLLLQNNNDASSEAKSVAWYVANIKAAQAKNNECRQDINASALQSTPDCINALHAIEISFK